MTQIKTFFAITTIIAVTILSIMAIDIYLGYEKHKELNDFFSLREPEFDKKKDNYINSVIDNHNVVFKKKIENLNSTSYTIQYPTLRLTVYHDYCIPYHQKEKWSYWVMDSTGNDIILQSTTISKHNVSKRTIERIQGICFRIENRR